MSLESPAFSSISDNIAAAVLSLIKATTEAELLAQDGAPAARELVRALAGVGQTLCLIGTGTDAIGLSQGESISTTLTPEEEEVLTNATSVTNSRRSPRNN